MASVQRWSACNVGWFLNAKENMKLIAGPQQASSLDAPVQMLVKVSMKRKLRRSFFSPYSAWICPLGIDWKMDDANQVEEDLNTSLHWVVKDYSPPESWSAGGRVKVFVYWLWKQINFYKIKSRDTLFITRTTYIQIKRYNLDFMPA